MVASGWGTGSWGLGPWGGGIPVGPLVLEGAVAISTKEVEVALSREVQLIAPTIAGDGLNPATWVIQNLSTGFLYSVLQVTQTGPLALTIQVLQDFDGVSVQHRVSSTTLLDSDGNPIASPPLNATDFAGVLANEKKDRVAYARRRSASVRDIANPPTPQNRLGTNIGGTLIINDAGDYELESGATLIKKLIIRRLTTRKGDFFHLPDYGVGIEVKGILSSANLIKLRAEVIRQVLREPEVIDADASVALGNENNLTVQVRAKIRPSNQEISFPVPLNATSVSI
jgi:hypothetical protein